MVAISPIIKIEEIKVWRKIPQAVVDQTVDALCRQLEWFNMSKTTAYEHIREQCLLSLKRVWLNSDNRNSDRVIELRKALADGWALKMDNFARNSVFIDEAGLLYAYNSEYGLVKKKKIQLMFACLHKEESH